MPTIDMPLKELEHYQGINPKPEDFDEFWDQGIKEMKQLVEEYRLVPAEFQVPGVECFDLYFTGVGGSQVYAKYARPANITKPIPAVVEFHGYSGSSPEWTYLLQYAAMGYATAYMDCRGQAGKSQDLTQVSGNTFQGLLIRGLESDPPEKLYFREVFLDTAQLANIVMSFDEIDETKVGAYGGSQGGGLAVACAALEPRISHVAPYFPFLTDYRRVWEMDLDIGAYRELRDFFRRVDPLHLREDEFFTKLGYIDVQYLAPRIEAKVLWAVSLLDETCPPSTQYAAYNKITSPKEILVYPDYSHEHLKGFSEHVMLFMLEMLEN